MSKSKERLFQELSSSIFSQENEEIVFRPKKKLFRDNSASSFSHGIKRVDTPTGTSLRPLDHSSEDLFGGMRLKRPSQNQKISQSRDRIQPIFSENEKVKVTPLFKRNKPPVIPIKISENPMRASINCFRDISADRASGQNNRIFHHFSTTEFYFSTLFGAEIECFDSV